MSFTYKVLSHMKRFTGIYPLLKRYPRRIKKRHVVPTLIASSSAGVFTTFFSDGKPKDPEPLKDDETIEPQSQVPDGDSLKTEHLIRNATMVSVESATTLLSYATAHLEDLQKEYIKGLYVLIKLMEVKLQYLGDPEQEKIESLILDTRATVNKCKLKVKEMELLYNTARKLTLAAGEAAYLTGAEYATTVTNNLLSSADTHLSGQHQNCVRAELDYAEAEAATIEAESKHEEKEKKKRERQKSQGDEQDSENKESENTENSGDEGDTDKLPQTFSSFNETNIKDIFEVSEEEVLRDDV